MNLSVGNIERKIAEYRRIKMSDFMVPELHDANTETMILIRDTFGELFHVPESVYHHDDYPSNYIRTFAREGFFIRWTAPGYLDCTEWSGPYDTEYDACYDLWLMHDSDTIPFHQWLRKYGIDLELKEKRQ